jgi:hypothetical protein
MRFRSFCWLVCAVTVITWHGSPITMLAKESCRISVSTILAARDDTTIDPKLKTHIGELQSMFNYTSYRLLGGENLTLDPGQSGTVSLPGEHQLNITLQHIRGDRANIALRMTKQNQSVFQTNIQLLNRGNLFVGGPKYLNGNLIFRISSAF